MKNNLKNKTFFKIILEIIYPLVLLFIVYESPIIAGRLAETVKSYYIILTTVMLTTSTPLILIHWNNLKNEKWTWGLAGGLLSYITITLILLSMGKLGRGISSPLQGTLIGVAIGSTSLALALSIYSIIKHIDDESIALVIGGLLAMIIPFTRSITTGYSILGLAGIMASSYSIGVATAYMIKRVSGISGVIYYITLTILLSSSPLGVGGALFTTSIIISIAALFGAWLATTIYLDNWNMFKINKSIRETSRRRLTAYGVIAGLIILGGALYAMGVIFWRPYAIVTGSMEPAINRGDLIILKKTNNIQIGDIISYKRRHTVITHRVYSINNGKIITKGDANSAPDPYTITHSNIIGKVWIRIPHAGWPLILANWNKGVRIGFLTLLLGLLGVVLVWPSKKQT